MQVAWEDIQLGSLIGSGGFADVHVATYKGETVAVKKWKPADLGPDQQKLFLRELQANHPNLVHTIGFCVQPLAIVMAFVKGRDLFKLIHDSRFSYTWAQALQIATGVAEGMAFLHTSGAIHRDLKSPNVLVDPNTFHVWVCDFGLARLKTATLKYTGGRGTVYWTAPEILKYAEYDESVDVFSFGILLWEIFARNLPYRQYNSVMMEIARAVVFNHERPPIPPGTPSLLAQLMQRCWAESPAQRPKMDEVLATLKNPACIPAPLLNQFIPRGY